MICKNCGATDEVYNPIHTDTKICVNSADCSARQQGKIQMPDGEWKSPKEVFS